jgi:hypothetical protein
MDVRNRDSKGMTAIPNCPTVNDHTSRAVRTAGAAVQQLASSHEYNDANWLPCLAPAHLLGITDFNIVL